MKPTLLILAAGMASRYGSMKQIQGFGPGGETIMDYSIYDAIRAGFGKVVFIIRKEFAADFQEIFEPKLKGRIDIDYVYQELEAFTGGYKIPAELSKNAVSIIIINMFHILNFLNKYAPGIKILFSCNIFCGSGHEDMAGRLIVTD